MRWLLYRVITILRFHCTSNLLADYCYSSDPQWIRCLRIVHLAVLKLHHLQVHETVLPTYKVNPNYPSLSTSKRNGGYKLSYNLHHFLYTSHATVLKGEREKEKISTVNCHLDKHVCFGYRELFWNHNIGAHQELYIHKQQSSMRLGRLSIIVTYIDCCSLKFDFSMWTSWWLHGKAY